MESKTAKGMFEDLGFKKYTYDTSIQYRKLVSLTNTKIIKFEFQRKLVFSENSSLNVVGININEHKAIHQQCKELGWLE